MPASPARIGFVTTPFRRVIAGPDAEVEARFGPLARDNTEPVETFFDGEADAQVIANERLALLSPTRRMFEHSISGDKHGRALDFTESLPTARVIDDDRSYDASALVVSIAVDLGRSATEFTTWG